MKFTLDVHIEGDGLILCEARVGGLYILGACILSFQQLLLKLSIHVFSVPRELLIKIQCYYYALLFLNLKWLFKN
jgi:hypothetical protein